MYNQYHLLVNIVEVPFVDNKKKCKVQLYKKLNLHYVFQTCTIHYSAFFFH